MADVDPAVVADLSAETKLPKDTVEEVVRHFQEVSCFCNLFY